MSRLLLSFLIVLLCFQMSYAQDTTVLQNATIYTAAGPIIKNGSIVFSNGKIVAVGKTDAVRFPKEAKIIDLTGKIVIPGLVDSHSHLGVSTRPHVPSNSDGNERTGPVQSVLRALDSLNPQDPGIRMAQAGGVTTANIMPGSSNVIGGQTVYVKLRGNSVEEMQIKADGVLGGLKMANGENPKRYGAKNLAPMTRMKVASLQRTEFMKAREYMRKWQRHREKLKEDKAAVPPEIDLKMEPLVEVLQGKRTVHFHTHRADDILTVLRLRREFGFELVLQHGTEGFKVLKQIAAAKVPVSMTIVDSPGGKAEVVDFIEACGAELTAAGVPVHVNTDDPVTESRFFLRTAAATLRGGLDTATALKAITLHPAQAMHLDHKVGSIEPGKDADLVVLSGAPFSVYTRVLETWIDGKRVFQLSNPKQRLYQTGGFPVAEIDQVPIQPNYPQARKPLPRPLVKPGLGRKPITNNGYVVVASRVHTVSNGVIENGFVHVKDGRIVAVGSRKDAAMPANVRIIAAVEVTPGLIDTHSVVPLAGEYNIPADQDSDEKTDPNQADARVLDAFNPSEPLLRFLLEQGVTVVHATPGRANPIGGMTGVFRTHGTNVEDMTIRYPQAMMFNLGAKPKSTYSGKAPATRMGTAALLRNAFQGAANYVAKQDRAANDDTKDAPETNLKHEALAQLIRGKVPAVFAAHRADDMLTAIRVAREFKVRPILALGTDGYLIANRLAKEKVPVIVHPTMQRVGSIETFNSFLGNAAALSDAGLTVSICSGVEGYVPKTRVIRWEAAIGMTYGLGFDRALKSITLDAAKILGIEKDYGSLEAGKVADLVLYNGDPFEHTTHVSQVIVDGKLVHNRPIRARILAIDRSQLSCPAPGCCVAF